MYATDCLNGISCSWKASSSFKGSCRCRLLPVAPYNEEHLLPLAGSMMNSVTASGSSIATVAVGEHVDRQSNGILGP